jgi:hypothetical protein
LRRPDRNFFIRKIFNIWWKAASLVCSATSKSTIWFKICLIAIRNVQRVLRRKRGQMFDWTTTWSHWLRVWTVCTTMSRFFTMSIAFWKSYRPICSRTYRKKSSLL